MKKHRMTRTALVLMVLFFGICFASGYFSSAQADEFSGPRQLFIEGNIAYKENNYAEAAAKYEKILRDGYVNANLYYNLANSYFKKGQLGEALLNYERAKLFMPSDSDVKSNEEYVRSLLQLSGPQTSGNWFDRSVDRLFAGFNVDRLSILVSVFYIVILAVFALGLVFAGLRKYSRPLAVILVVFLILSFTGLQRKIGYIRHGAIVIIREAEVKFEPLETATLYFRLSEGNSVDVLEKTRGWYKIKRPDGKIGWIRDSALEMISG